MAKYNDQGEEIPDNTPVELPLGYEHPEGLESMIARMVRTEAILRENTGLESEEEANDFDVDEDGEPMVIGKHTWTEMQEEELRQLDKELRNEQQRRAREASVTGEAPEDAPKKKGTKVLVKKDVKKAAANDIEATDEQ